MPLSPSLGSRGAVSVWLFAGVVDGNGTSAGSFLVSHERDELTVKCRLHFLLRDRLFLSLATLLEESFVPLFIIFYIVE